MKIGKLVGYSVGLVALGLFVQGCSSTGTSSSPSPAASSPGPAASPAPNTASSPKHLYCTEKNSHVDERSR
jgi:hypothetical protein